MDIKHRLSKIDSDYAILSCYSFILIREAQVVLWFRFETILLRLTEVVDPAVTPLSGQFECVLFEKTCGCLAQLL